MSSQITLVLALSAICFANAMPNEYGYDKQSYKPSYGYEKESYKPSYGYEKESYKPSYGYEKQSYKPSYGYESKYAVPYYDFAWKVKAIGSGKHGYGGGYGYDDGYSKGEALEFGQQEKRYGYKTEGGWGSELPYGGHMKMDYLVDAKQQGYY